MRMQTTQNLCNAPWLTILFLHWDILWLTNRHKLILAHSQSNESEKNNITRNHHRHHHHHRSPSRHLPYFWGGCFSSRPKDPIDLQFELDEECLPEDFVSADVHAGSKQHLVFATDAQPQQLVRAKTWYLDGTFKLVRQPLTELFSVNALRCSLTVYIRIVHLSLWKP